MSTCPETNDINYVHSCVSQNDKIVSNYQNNRSYKIEILRKFLWLRDLSFDTTNTSDLMAV